MNFECTFMNSYNLVVEEVSNIKSIKAMAEYAKRDAINRLMEHAYLTPSAYIVTEIYSKDHHQYAYTYLVDSLSEYMAIRNSDSRFVDYNDGGHKDFTWRWVYYLKKSNGLQPATSSIYDCTEVKASLIKIILTMEKGLASAYDEIMHDLLKKG